MKSMKFLPGSVNEYTRCVPRIVRIPDNPVIFIALISCMMASCISLQRGYIRETPGIEERIARNEMAADSSVMAVCQNQQRLSEEAIRLAGQYPSGRKEIFKAPLLNGIFELMQEQMRDDSLLFAVARSGNYPLAVSALLESANRYDRFFRQNTRVRRMVNRGNKAYELPPRLLNKTRRFLLTPSVRKEAAPLFPDSLIPHASLAALAGFGLFRNGDRLNETGYDVVNALSAVFGNSVGSLNKARNRTREMECLSNLVQPLDIVLMKSVTHVTDKFIPGFFGHVGIYLGNATQVDTIGWPQLPHLPEYQKLIDEGYCYAEALRSGGTLSNLEEFTDGEYFLILRIPGISGEEKRKTLARILRYAYQPYDFNFDVESPDRLYCSELVYLSFEGIDWKSHRKWSRVSISPDEIALTALENLQVERVALILPGSVVEKPTEQMIRELMEE